MHSARPRAAALLVLLLLASLAPIAAAQDPAPSSPPRGSVWTVFNTVEADVQDNYATVRVIADIRNQGPDPEFPFQVRVPDDAFVTGLVIERDGEVYEARVEEREAARQEYEEHKAREQTGGLVEKARRSSTYAFLINVAEFTNVRATLTYEQYLVADRGVHNLSLEAPVSGFGRDLGARFNVTVRHQDGVPLAWGSPDARVAQLENGWSLAHEVGPRETDASTPFQASYTLSPTDESGSLLVTIHNGTGYFAHRFRAPTEARTMPLDLVLVLDVSGSMSGAKMTQMQDAAAQVVRLLREGDRLHLVPFSSDAMPSWQGMRAMTPEARRAAVDEVRHLVAAGGTNLEGAMREGFAGMEGIDWAREEGRLPLLVVLTDGQPTAGVTDRDELRRLAREANAHDVPVFAIAFGRDADWSFVHGVATDNGGAALRVPEGAGAEVDLSRFLAALTTPVLKDVRIEYGEGVNATRTGAPILFAGSELLVVGRFDPALGLPAGSVRGVSTEGTREYSFAAQETDANLRFLPRLVSYHDIRRLQALIDAEGERAEWVDEVTRIAMRQGFVTDYTSLVLTLPPREGTPDSNATLADAPRTATPTPVPTAPTAPALTGWASSSADAEGETMSGRGPPAQEPTPTTPSVPGPGIVLVVGVLALAALALGGRRR